MHHQHLLGVDDQVPAQHRLDAARPDLSQPMQREWTLTQELPFPGRTWAQGRVASHQADAKAALPAILPDGRSALLGLVADAVVERYR